MNQVFRFDAESYCLVHCMANCDVVRVTSNLASRAVAEQYAAAVRESGGHVFHVIPAGVLVAALHLVKDQSPAVVSCRKCHSALYDEAAKEGVCCDCRQREGVVAKANVVQPTVSIELDKETLEFLIGSARGHELFLMRDRYFRDKVVGQLVERLPELETGLTGE